MCSAVRNPRRDGTSPGNAEPGVGMSSPIICSISRPLIRRPIPSIWCSTISPPTRAKPSRTALGKQAGNWIWNRFIPHYTPKHGSWLNQAEMEISLFSRQCLGRRRIPALADLERETEAWNQKMNRDLALIDWRFTRKKARRKFRYRRNDIMRSQY